jgi:hypothetical protein
MPLTMHPTGLGAGIDEDRLDYTIYSGGWAVGRIYEIRGGPDTLRWFWSLTLNLRWHAPIGCRAWRKPSAVSEVLEAWKAWAKQESAGIACCRMKERPGVPGPAGCDLDHRFTEKRWALWRAAACVRAACEQPDADRIAPCHALWKG